MFNSSHFENSRPNGIPVLEVVTDSETRAKQFIPLIRTSLLGEVTGPLASLKVVQTYRYSREQCDKVLEAVYRFPLPGDAAVSSVVVKFGDVEIRSCLKERGQAEQDYDQAKQRGRPAALLTRESPDVFTLRVAGLQPDQEVTVTTSYVQLARAEGKGWSLRIPLTTAPRYVRGDEIASRHASGQPLAVMRDPGHRFELDLMLPRDCKVNSSTHRLATTTEGDRPRVRLHDGNVVPDRDCVIAWQPLGEPDRPSLQVFTYQRDEDNHTYFLAHIAPPATRDRNPGIPREVILLVDHSGSMRGAKWEAADWAVERFVRDLSEHDRFNVGLFHSTTHWFATETRLATSSVKDETIKFLKEHSDSGGTELGVALEQALHLRASADDCARHVLIITDAEVTDAGRLLHLVDLEATKSDRRRVSVLCIDAAPNSTLVNELAERGGGIARFLTSRPDEQDITTALDETLADWSEPVLRDLHLEVDRRVVESSHRPSIDSREEGWRAIDLGDLPAGRSMWISGRLRRNGADKLTFRLRTAKGHELARTAVERLSHGTSALKALFGARRISGLEYLAHSAYSLEDLSDRIRRLGYDPEEVLTGRGADKIYAENARIEIFQSLRKLIVSESLHYGLASSETAFVAARTENGKTIEESIAVANALPEGWSDEFVAADMDTCYFKSPPRAHIRAIHLQSLLAGSKRGISMPAGLVASIPDSLMADQLNKPTVVFSGQPHLTDGEAILFDSAARPDTIPESVEIHGIEIRPLHPVTAIEDIDRDIRLRIHIDDLETPRAEVRLIDVWNRQRPLNLLKLPGQTILIVLADPNETWNRHPLNFEAVIHCR
jgi:Ca-activated chloride channel family protein